MNREIGHFFLGKSFYFGDAVVEKAVDITDFFSDGNEQLSLGRRIVVIYGYLARKKLIADICNPFSPYLVHSRMGLNIFLNGGHGFEGADNRALKTFCHCWGIQSGRLIEVMRQNAP